MNKVTLKFHRDKRIRSGHLWVFSNEIYTVDGTPESGEVVEAYTSDGDAVGVGYYNPHSLIAFRLLSDKIEVIDAAFYLKKIEKAVALRNRFRPGATAVRIVHAESDGLSGLTVDRIGDVLSVQIVSAGAERQQDYIIAALKKVLSPKFIVLRNDSGLRTLEGLPNYTKVVHGESPIPLQDIEEHGIRYEVNVEEGQKTGFYIDQHENRRVFKASIAKGDRVLDAFCNEGGFALNAAAAGAKEVLAIDNSESALKRAAENAKRNNSDGQIVFQKADLMKWMPENADKLTFDVINLDPPSFAKNRKTAVPALKGYQKLHEAALKMLTDGGFLATATCSHHIETNRFVDTVTDAARRVGRRVTLIHRGSQPADHPILPAMPETEYLRFFIFQVHH